MSQPAHRSLDRSRSGGLSSNIFIKFANFVKSVRNYDALSPVPAGFLKEMILSPGGHPAAPQGTLHSYHPLISGLA